MREEERGRRKVRRKGRDSNNYSNLPTNFLDEFPSMFSVLEKNENPKSYFDLKPSKIGIFAAESGEIFGRKILSDFRSPFQGGKFSSSNKKNYRAGSQGFRRGPGQVGGWDPLPSPLWQLAFPGEGKFKRLTSTL